MSRVIVAATALLILLPGIAHAGEFPGLVETIFAVLTGLALLLGAATEWVQALRQHRALRWQRCLLYSALWLGGMLLVLWLRR